jgi:hypothetical protein
MRRATRAAAGSAAGLTLMGVAVAPVSASQPAIHFEEDAAGDTIVCESNTYTITSGSIMFTIHEGQGQTGNTNFTGTITPQDVVAEDSAGNEVDVSGAFWFGGTSNTRRGTEQFWSTGKLQLVDQGAGSVDSVNVTFFIQVVDGEVTNIKDFDFGTCAEPD